MGGLQGAKTRLQSVKTGAGGEKVKIVGVVCEGVGTSLQELGGERQKSNGVIVGER